MTHIHCDNNSTQVFGDLYGRLSIVLVRANARAILARSLQVAGIQVDATVLINSVCSCIMIIV